MVVLILARLCEGTRHQKHLVRKDCEYEEQKNYTISTLAITLEPFFIAHADYNNNIYIYIYTDDHKLSPQQDLLITLEQFHHSFNG